MLLLTGERTRTPPRQTTGQIAWTTSCDLVGFVLRPTTFAS